jgi:2-keto-4-pentenoate hydratase
MEPTMPTPPAEDPRIMAGMRAQLDKRAGRLAAGARHLGWKAGFGAAANIAKFDLPGPLMGHMLQDARIASGDTVSVAGWKKPVAEPEIAAWIGADLPDGTDKDAVRRAVSALGPAIELADLDPPPEDVATILAGNIFHRRVILGLADASRTGARLDGVSGLVTRKGSSLPPVDALEANTGRLVDIVAHLADTLAACGERMKAGDVVICGSIVPPLLLDTADNEIIYRLDPIGEVSIRFSHA